MVQCSNLKLKSGCSNTFIAYSMEPNNTPAAIEMNSAASKCKTLHANIE